MTKVPPAEKAVAKQNQAGEDMQVFYAVVRCVNSGDFKTENELRHVTGHIINCATSSESVMMVRCSSILSSDEMEKLTGNPVMIHPDELARMLDPDPSADLEPVPEDSSRKTVRLTEKQITLAGRMLEIALAQATSMDIPDLITQLAVDNLKADTVTLINLLAEAQRNS